jgi:hypothetical protein
MAAATLAPEFLKAFLWRTTYSDALTVTGDIVLSQDEMTYDSSGLVLLAVAHLFLIAFLAELAL